MRFLFSILCIASFARAFIFDRTQIRPGLKELADAQIEKKLKIMMDIGKEEAQSRFAVHDLIFALQNHPAEKGSSVALPGSDGPHRTLSSGARSLNLIKEGHYITAAGMQLIHSFKGCWEMIWRKDASAGAFLCGFEIPEDYKRNDATLPKGRIYLSFPIWTKEGLDFARQEKVRIMARAKMFLDEKNEELKRYQEATNLLQKALHYRNAYEATEKYWLQPVKSMQQVPDENEVVELQDDLLLTTKGLVWTKSDGIFGKQVLLGTAKLATVVEG